MKPGAIAVVLLVVAAAAGVFVWQRGRGEDAASGELTVHGNVDLRQVDLAFRLSERVTEVLADEGDRVKAGQVLARLDSTRLTPQVAQAEADAEAARQVAARLRSGSRPEEIARAEHDAEAARQVLDRLTAGTRPEEIAEARAQVDAAKAGAASARIRYERLVRARDASTSSAVSDLDVDDAKSALDVAEAEVVVRERALDLAVAGPRKEEIAEADARLAAARSALELLRAGARREEIAEADARVAAAEQRVALLKRNLADAELTAPADAVVRTRVLEPGAMAAPDRPAFQLAVMDPKWVRAWVAEPDLGRVKAGAKAAVVVDAFPGRRFDAWVGSVSSVAEFTPKSVETEELRSSLVYEVRVFVKDPQDELRLGMPATVFLGTVHLDAGGAPDGAPPR